MVDAMGQANHEVNLLHHTQNNSFHIFLSTCKWILSKQLHLFVTQFLT